MVKYRDALTGLANVIVGARLLPSGLRPSLYRLFGVTVGQNARILDHLTLRPGRVRIGSNVLINQDCLLDPGPSYIEIEDGVALGAGVRLIASSHKVGPASRRAGQLIGRPIFIGEGSWLGASVTVLGGVTIAPGCIIGAGAVVIRDTDADGIYVGVPARRHRSVGDGD